MSITNATAVLDVVNKGPYYARYDAGRVIDILYLTIVSVIGTFGNLTVILSIIHGRRLTKNGNIFIINLAIADFIVSDTSDCSFAARTFCTETPCVRKTKAKIIDGYNSKFVITDSFSLIIFRN